VAGIGEEDYAMSVPPYGHGKAGKQGETICSGYTNTYP